MNNNSLIRRCWLGLCAVALLAAGAPHPAAAADVITIRVTDETPVGHFIDVTIRNWGKRVEAETKGRVKVEVFSNGQLYNDREAVRAIARGDLEMNVSITPWMAQVEPKMLAISLPYLVGSMDEFVGLWDSEIGQRLASLLARKDVKALAIWPTGKHILATKKPLLKMEDMRGMKLRVSGGKPYEAAVAALGGSGVTLAAPEIPMAIETGVVDGINGAMSFWAANYPQSLPNAVVIKMWQSGFGVWANATFWNGLPPDIRKILETAMVDATKDEIALVQRQDEETAAAAVAKGAKVNVLAPEEEARWKAATAVVYKQFPDLADFAAGKK
jgi:C4-dicarboxylate-binding protein DctP